MTFWSKGLALGAAMAGLSAVPVYATETIKAVVIDGYPARALWVRDMDGQGIANATIDIWQTAPNGLYSSQDPDQHIHSFHGLMTADEHGRYAFTTVRPVSYTVPTDGPVGKILNAAGRHPWRPSHLHYIVAADGFRSLVTEVFPCDDPYLQEDTVFGVRDDLIMQYAAQPAGSFPDGFELSGKVLDSYSRVDFDLILARA